MKLSAWKNLCAAALVLMLNLCVLSVSHSEEQSVGSGDGMTGESPDDDHGQRRHRRAADHTKASVGPSHFGTESESG